MEGSQTETKAMHCGYDLSEKSLISMSNDWHTYIETL